jgi:cobalt-precorrin-5B (C1)-methyltransferase
MKQKRLRSGFTTGACAAAAAKAASLQLIHDREVAAVEVPFPDGSSHTFAVHRCQLSEGIAFASIIKDAGDDPDVTNRAEIWAQVQRGTVTKGAGECVRFHKLQLCRGKGVGRVTKPGLAIAPGEPAINPVPRRMIEQAVSEIAPGVELTITIGVTNGEELAQKTLNHRLGILGGLSILGTTGIVRPISAHAWKATIQASLDVAKSLGLAEVVFSTGRTSEKAAEEFLQLPEESYAMMGDYLEFSMLAAKEYPFHTIHLAAMWAKLIKAALKIPQTHVRNGALEVAHGVELLASLGCRPELAAQLRNANTAREIYLRLEEAAEFDLIEKVCRKAKEYCEELTGRRVMVYLVNHKADIICHV